MRWGFLASLFLSACGYLRYERVDANVQAEAPTFAAEVGFGDGHWGDIIVDDEFEPNRFARLLRDVGAAERILEMSTVFARRGDLLMVWQSSSAAVAESASSATLVLADEENAGRWEFARVERVEGSRVELERGLQYAYAAGLSQVVLIPEFRRVELLTQGRLTTRPWDGRLGGILVFLVNQELRMEGEVSAEASGFAGGVEPSPILNVRGCSELNESPERAGGKGEGLMRLDPSSTPQGRGNVANGGGGGVCHNAGGGGGGHAGFGGKGGWAQDGGRDVGGLPGVALDYAPPNRLIMGGGGGAGEANDSGVPPRGGHGGGAIFVRAERLVGAGRWNAQGGAPNTTYLIDDGGSGGGAGGLIVLEAKTRLECGIASVAGGPGWGTAVDHGPGGGGGGGFLWMRSPSIACPTDVRGGPPGRAGSGEFRGEEAGQDGVVFTPM